MELFDWLKTLYEIWKNLDAEVIRLSSLTGMGELMKHGCTTCFDHHYVFPTGRRRPARRAVRRGGRAGHPVCTPPAAAWTSRVKDGGLPPDSVVQTVDEIMTDSDALSSSSTTTAASAQCASVALAPCSPFSVSRGAAARRARSSPGSTACGCTRTCARRRTRKTSCSRVRACARWSTWRRSAGPAPDVWYAHGIHFNDEELRVLAETGTGVCHCPISNMKLASGIARIPEMLELGVPVGLGVDGSRQQRRLQSCMEELRVAYPAPPAQLQQGRTQRL